jgi:hypothetical protein
LTERVSKERATTYGFNWLDDEATASDLINNEIFSNNTNENITNANINLINTN